MKILYIATDIFRNSSASIRNVSLIKGLLELENEVEILTLNYLEENEDIFLKNTLLSNEYNNLKIYKIDVPFFNSIKNNKFLGKKKSNLLTSIKKIIKENIFFPDNLFESIKNSLKFEGGNYDIIVSSSDSKTSHFIAENLLNKKKIIGKWIQIWGDPWQNDIGLKNINFLMRKRIEVSEKRLLNKADKVFYISELTAKIMREKIKDFDKINVLARSYLIKINNKEYNFNKDRINISYTGVLSKRNIKPIIELVNDNNTNSEKKIYLNFYGVNIKEYTEFKNMFVNFYSKVNLIEIEKIYNNTDILLYIDNEKGSTQIPGKIYDYCGTNKPILALVESEETKNILKKFDNIIIYNNIKKEIKLDEVIKNLKLREVDEKFSPRNVAEDFINNLKK